MDGAHDWSIWIDFDDDPRLVKITIWETEYRKIKRFCHRCRKWQYGMTKLLDEVKGNRIS